MLDIILLGINHKTASVEVRECIAFAEEETKSALHSLLGKSFIKEALLFSTCNRVEILLVTDNKTRAVEETKAFIAEFNKIPLEQFEDALYLHEGDDAVRHVFRVASNADANRETVSGAGVMTSRSGVAPSRPATLSANSCCALAAICCSRSDSVVLMTSDLPAIRAVDSLHASSVS